MMFLVKPYILIGLFMFLLYRIAILAGYEDTYPIISFKHEGETKTCQAVLEGCGYMCMDKPFRCVTNAKVLRSEPRKKNK